jgi:hypothetical protein
LGDEKTRRVDETKSGKQFDLLGKLITVPTAFGSYSSTSKLGITQEGLKAGTAA